MSWITFILPIAGPRAGAHDGYSHALEVSVDPGLTCEGLDRMEIWELARAIKGALAEVQQAQ